MGSEAKFTPGPWEWQVDTIDRGSKKGSPIRKRLWTGKLSTTASKDVREKD